MGKPDSNKTLFDFICDQMDQLDQGKIDVDVAKSQATLAKQANNSLRYELDRTKTMIRLDEYNKQNETKIKLRNAENKEDF